MFTLYAALTMARERGLDLVEVAPNSVPPVCRLMDYGRYKYEQQKKDQEAHRTQRTNDLKEVRMAPVIDDHDIETKTKLIRKFVEEGDKVKVTIQFRGPQMRHQEIGRDVLERILTSLRGAAVLERPIIMEGRNMSMFVGASAGRQGQAAGTPAPADGVRGRSQPGAPGQPEGAASRQAVAPLAPTADGAAQSEELPRSNASPGGTRANGPIGAQRSPSGQTTGGSTDSASPGRVQPSPPPSSAGTAQSIEDATAEKLKPPTRSRA